MLKGCCGAVVLRTAHVQSADIPAGYVVAVFCTLKSVTPLRFCGGVNRVQILQSALEELSELLHGGGSDKK